MNADKDPGREKIADLYDRYGSKVYGYLLLMLSSHADTEDAMHEVFCRIWERSLADHAIDNPAAYLFRAAHNEACSQIRRRWRRPIWRDRLNGRFCALEAQADRMSTIENCEAVAYALSKLPFRQREIVVLKVFQNLTFAEIAQALDISLNTAASRYRYALAKLGALLKKEGFNP